MELVLQTQRVKWRGNTLEGLQCTPYCTEYVHTLYETCHHSYRVNQRVKKACIQNCILVPDCTIQAAATSRCDKI